MGAANYLKSTNGEGECFDMGGDVKKKAAFQKGYFLVDDCKAFFLSPTVNPKFECSSESCDFPTLGT